MARWLALVLVALIPAACTFDPNGGDLGELRDPSGDVDDGGGAADQPDSPGETQDSAEPGEPPRGSEDDPTDDPDCQESWIQLLSNPDFDEGQVAWDEDTFFEVITDHGPLEADSPSQSAWLAGYPYADERISQEVEVPDDALALRVRAAVATDLAVFDGPDDHLAVELVDADGDALETLSDLASGGMAEQWQPLSEEADDAHAGEVVELSFHAETRLSGVSFLVDTVALEALVCR